MSGANGVGWWDRGQPSWEEEEFVAGKEALAEEGKGSFFPGSETQGKGGLLPGRKAAQGGLVGQGNPFGWGALLLHEFLGKSLGGIHDQRGVHQDKGLGGD